MLWSRQNSLCFLHFLFSLEVKIKHLFYYHCPLRDIPRTLYNLNQNPKCCRICYKNFIPLLVVTQLNICVKNFKFSLCWLQAKTYFYTFWANFLCFPRLEKWKSKFPILPVPWQPCRYYCTLYVDTAALHDPRDNQITRNDVSIDSDALQDRTGGSWKQVVSEDRRTRTSTTC